MNEQEPSVPQSEIRNPIITFNDQQRWPILETISKPCSFPLSGEDEEVIVFMDSILDQLDTEAAGLAAVQVGYAKQIFLLRNKVNEDGKPENNAYINPILLKKSTEQKRDGEACLSLPGMGVAIKRPKSVTISYTDISGEQKVETFTGFWARAVSHELDHLNGVMILNHLQKAASKTVRRSKCGMILDAAAQKRIAKRRAKKKFAKHNR